MRRAPSSKATPNLADSTTLSQAQVSHETLTAIHFAFKSRDRRRDDPDRRTDRLDRPHCAGQFRGLAANLGIDTALSAVVARPTLRRPLCALVDLLRHYRYRPQDRLRVKRAGTLGLLLFTCVELTRL